jgi:hypothetical protein
MFIYTKLSGVKAVPTSKVRLASIYFLVMRNEKDRKFGGRMSSSGIIFLIKTYQLL